jgi:ParB family chromosome partitioning protein
MKNLISTNEGFELDLEFLSIQPGFNLREDTVPEERMVSSVRENGVLNAIHIRQAGDKEGHYWVVDGERRFNAATLAESDSVPVVPHADLGDLEALVMSMATNEDQKPLTAAERAQGFLRLHEAEVPEHEIARLMGSSERTVKETLKVIFQGSKKLQEGISDAPKNGGIPVRAAAQAADLPDEVQEDIAPDMAGKTTEEASAVVDLAKERQARKTGKKSPKSAKKKVYAFGRDGKKRASVLADLIAGELASKPKDKVLLAQRDILLCLHGKKDITELFPE